MKLITIVEPNSISKEDKKLLFQEGYLVIESAKPTSIIFAERPETEYIFINCAACGERIYMLSERHAVLMKNYKSFFCTQGHSNIYTNPTQP